MSESASNLASVDSIIDSLGSNGYICNEQIATVVYLAAALGEAYSGRGTSWRWKNRARKNLRFNRRKPSGEIAVLRGPR